MQDRFNGGGEGGRLPGPEAPRRPTQAGRRRLRARAADTRPCRLLVFCMYLSRGILDHRGRPRPRDRVP